MKKLLILPLLLNVLFVFSQNTCTWTSDGGKTPEQNLKDLLQCLIDGESDTIMKNHFQGILDVCNHPDADFGNFTPQTNGAITFLNGVGKDLSTYLNRSQPRQLVRAFTSPSDGIVVWYKIGLPGSWDINTTDYPLMLDLHGRGATNNPLKMLFGNLQPSVAGVSNEDYRGDGYHIVPWGRGDRDYEGQAGQVIFEVLDHFDARFETNPVQQYIYGFSMGGGGTYKISKESMERWAAVAMFSPALFQPDYFEATRFEHMPVWHFWGDSETFVHLSRDLRGYFLLNGMDEYVWNEEAGWGHSYAGNFQTEMLDFLLKYSKGKPFMDKLNDQEPYLTGSGQQTILLTGIEDGNEGTQNLTITATTSQPANLEIDSVEYIGGDTAVLYFKPLAESMASVRIRLKDDGGTDYNVSDTAIYTFDIGIYDQVNNNPAFVLPTIDTIPEDVSADFIITGINDGDGLSQQLTFSSWVFDSVMLPAPFFNYVQGNDSAMLTLVSGENMNGANLLEITLADDGAAAGNNGNASKKVQLEVFVKPVNDPPVAILPGDQNPIDADAGEQSLAVVQIDDGDEEVDQEVTVSVFADNPALFDELYYETVSASSGYLKYTPDPDQSGQTNIHILFRDNGGKADNGIDSFLHKVSVEFNHVQNSVTRHETVFRVYPNPMQDFIVIDGNKRITAIEILSVTGQKKICQGVDNERYIRVNTCVLPKGIYLMKIHHTDGYSMKKLVRE